MGMYLSGGVPARECTCLRVVPTQEVYLPGGCTCLGGYLSGECTCLGGCTYLGVYLPRGVYCPGGTYPGSVPIWEVYLVPGGVPGPGGCTWFRGSVPGPGGVPGPEGVYLVPGSVPGTGAGGVPGPTGVPAQVLPPVDLVSGGGGYLPRYSPLWTERHV